MQGWRVSMEDAYIAILELVPSCSLDLMKPEAKLSIFGIFDGHGGYNVASFGRQ